MTGETLETIKIKLTLIAIECPVLLLDMSLQEYGKQHFFNTNEEFNG